MITTRRMFYTYSFIKDAVFFAAALTPFYTDFGHLNAQQLLLVQAWFLFCVFLFEVPTGAIADLFGRKWSLVAGAATVTVTLIIYPIRPEFWWFLVAETLFALSETLISGADEAWIVDSLAGAKQEEITAVLTRGQTWNQVGMLVGALIGSGILTQLDVRWPMWLSSIVGILTLMTALQMKEPPRRTAAQKETWQHYWGTITTGFRYFVGHVQLRKLALDGILVSTTAYFVIWFYQPMLGMTGVPKEQYGLYHAGLLLAEIPIAALYTPLSQWLGQKRSIWITAVLAALGIVIATVAWAVGSVSAMYWGTLVFIALGGGVGLTRMGLVRSYMHQHIEDHQRATVLSAMSMFSRFSPGMIIPVMGWLFVRDPVYALAVLGVICVMPVFFRGE